MSRYPASAQHGLMALSTGDHCSCCECELDSREEQTAGLSPGGELLCSTCLREAWDDESCREALERETEQQRRDLLAQAYEAEKREEAAAVLAREFREAGKPAEVFELRRARWRDVAALKRAAASGLDLIGQQGAAE